MLVRSNADLMDRFSCLRAYDKARQLVQDLLFCEQLPKEHPWASENPWAALEPYAAHQAAVDIGLMALGYFSTEATHYLRGYVQHLLAGLRQECMEALIDIAAGYAPVDRESTIRAALVLIESLQHTRLPVPTKEH